MFTTSHTNDDGDDEDEYYDHTCQGTCADGADCKRGVKGLQHTGAVSDQYCHDHQWQMTIGTTKHPRMTHTLPLGESVHVAVLEVENEPYEFGEHQRVRTFYGVMYANPDQFDTGHYSVTVRRSNADRDKLRLDIDPVGTTGGDR